MTTLEFCETVLQLALMQLNMSFERRSNDVTVNSQLEVAIFNFSCCVNDSKNLYIESCYMPF